MPAKRAQGREYKNEATSKQPVQAKDLGQDQSK